MNLYLKMTCPWRPRSSEPNGGFKTQVSLKVVGFPDYVQNILSLKQSKKQGELCRNKLKYGVQWATVWPVAYFNLLQSNSSYIFWWKFQMAPTKSGRNYWRTNKAGHVTQLIHSRGNLGHADLLFATKIGPFSSFGILDNIKVNFLKQWNILIPKDALHTHV